MRISRCLVTWTMAWGLLSLAAIAESTSEKPAGIDVLRAYEGTWDISIQHLDTAHSKASAEKNSLRNDCWKSGGYFACNQYVDGDSKVLLVFTYDSSKRAYTSYQIPLHGGETGAGELVIDGSTWTFPWQVKDGEKTTWYHVVNAFRGPDQIEFRQEFSDDDAHWTVMARGTEKRVSRP